MRKEGRESCGISFKKCSWKSFFLQCVNITVIYIPLGDRGVGGREGVGIKEDIKGR